MAETPIVEQVAERIGSVRSRGIRTQDAARLEAKAVVALVGEHERAGWTVEYAVQCASGKEHEYQRSRVRWRVKTDQDFAELRATITDTSSRFCGPHSVVERFVGPWRIAREVSR